MGSLLAAYLTEGGLDVVLMDHRSERAEQIQRDGIVVQGVRGEHRARVRVSADASSMEPVDLVIVCVKAYATELALQQHVALLSPRTTVWSLQNGWGNLEAIERVVPIGQIVGGSTTLGAHLIAPGRVQHAGEGDTYIGELTGHPSRRVKDIARALTESGVVVQVHTDIRRVIWLKLLVNAGINALTAILRVRNGAILDHESTRGLMDAAIREGVRAAATQGVEFDEEKIIAAVEEVARKTALNRSSMLQDILAERRTEIDFINGVIARLGAAPVNHALTALVQGLESTFKVRQHPIS